MQIQPYLMFDGRADEAAQFYQAALGAEITMLMRYKDCPEKITIRAGTEDKVMHMALRIGESTVLLSDGKCAGTPGFQGFSLALTAADDAEAEQRFAALAEGGKVTMPLDKTFFSRKFGMLTDRFGIGWMILVRHQAS